MDHHTRSRTASENPRVQEAMLDYLNRIERGELLDREAFLAQHVEIIHELRPLIERDAQARQAAKGNSPVTASLVQGGKPKPSARAEVTTHSAVGAIQQTMGAQTTPGASGSQPSGSMVADLPPVFGRYHIHKKLGSGAMGAVYLAEDSSLGRLVAIKTPTFENDSDGELLRRFHREARAVASLKHPGLCAVYEVGTIDGRHYISMEFVAGKKLADCIKSEKLMTEKQAMAVVRKIALAMHEAHLHGVIHRDLKPDNIMVNEKGDPVVMDFGLVHKTESKDSTKLTQHGTLIGSPAYMSKEQVEGDPDKLTAATDQYSLGVVLYQLLTAKLPFEGGLHAVLGAILTKEPPPPSKHRPDLNPNLEAVCLKMMAKEAKDRFPSMKAAAEALADVARGTSTLAGNSVAARAKRNSQNNEATETTLEVMPDAGVGDADDFDFKSPLVSSPARKPQRRKKSNSPNALLIGGISAGVLLLAAIIWFQFGNTQVKVEVLAEGFDVKFNEAGITVSDGTSETKVKPGQHTLHITSIKPGANGTVEEFDTEQLTLKKGGKPVVSVSIENGAAVAKLDGKVIPRRSLTVSSTGNSKSDRVDEKRPSPNSVAPVADRVVPKTDYDAIATGKWVRLVDATTTLPDPARMKFKDDVLELDSTVLRFNNISARNVILRAKIIKASGENCSLSVRESDASYTYGGYFAGGNVFGIGKAGKTNWTDLFRQSVGPVRNSFFEMAVSMTEDRITIYADGKAIHSTQDTEHDRGTVAILAYKGVSLFKDVEVMVLDKPTVVVPPPVGITDLDRVATGKWLPLIDANTPITDPMRMRLQEGGLRLEGADFLSRGISARNIVVRADVRETHGANINLALRATDIENSPKSAGMIYNCESNGLVVIGHIENKKWNLYDSVSVDRKILPDQFVNVAFSAIGNTLTAYIDGKRVLETQTSHLDSGGIRLRSFSGIHLFKNVEYQILDPASATVKSNVGTSNAKTPKLIDETSDELIQNGSGSEAGPGGLVGWKVLSGQWDKTYVWWKGKPPDHFAVGDVPSGVIEQVVDLSRYADAIDRSNVELKLSWKLKVSDGDIGRVEMIPLDENRKELGSPYDSGWQNHRSTEWKRFDNSISPVKGVRYIRARLSSKLVPRPGNRESSAYFREVSLRAVVKKP